VISDWEIWACANHYITRHGEDAPIIAAMRADELMSEGDMQCARTFQMIVKRINQLLEPPSGPLHQKCPPGIHAGDYFCHPLGA